MRALGNPVLQFLLVGALTLGVVVVATGELSRRAAHDEAVLDAQTTTELLAYSVAEPALTRGLLGGQPGALDRFDRAVLPRLVVDEVQRIKIWNGGGEVIYSDETRLIGQRYPLGPDEREVLTVGGTQAEVSELARDENLFEGAEAGLVEVYTRIQAPDGSPLLFEAYFSADDIAAREREIFAAFRPVGLAGLIVLGVFALLLVWLLDRRVTRAARERERLLRAAVEASDAERRRIARDLHDGVVQDLAGTSFRLSGFAHGAEPAPPTALAEMSGALRRSLRSLRSLLVEIYPPQVDEGHLESALEDLLAPAEAQGVHTTVSVGDLHDAGPALVALAWRVAQESVRNALRHGSPRTLDVSADLVDGHLVTRIVDDGVGFDPESVAGDRLGLRGLRDLVRESGGRLDITTGPGRGTAVEMAVATS